jgi:GT2 family glycosyltransferase
MLQTLEHDEERTKSDLRPAAILVLGMHRSGTSAAARVLSLLGAALPTSVVGPAKSNPTGHWEPASLVAIHDEMLAALNSSWDDLAPVKLEQLAPEARTGFKKRVLRVLRDEYGNARQLVIKDPRVCRLLPFWLEVLEEYGAEPVVVVPVRSPVDVARSLTARDRMTRDYAQAIWLRHVLDAEHDSRPLRRTFFSYDEMLQDWRSVFADVAEDTGLAFDFEANAATIDGFLSRDLRHHATTLSELQQDPTIPRVFTDAFECLIKLEKHRNDPDVESKLDEIAREFDSSLSEQVRIYRAEVEARRLHVDDFLRSVPNLEHELTVLRSEVVTQRTRADTLQEQATAIHQHLTATAEHAGATTARLNAEMHERNLTIDRMSEQIAELNRTLIEARRMLAERELALSEQVLRTEAKSQELEEQKSAYEGLRLESEHTIHHLNARIEAQQEYINQLQESLSWRLTQPLRSAATKHSGGYRAVRRLAKLGYWTATLQLPRRLRDRRERQNQASQLIASDSASTHDDPVAWRLRSFLKGTDLSVASHGGLALENDQLVGTNSDPHVLIALRQPLPRGWCRVEVVFSSDKEFAPRVYFDFGSGLSEAASEVLYRDGANQFSATVHVPQPVTAIRLDPTDFPGPVELVSIAIRPLQVSERARLFAEEWRSLRARGETLSTTFQQVRAAKSAESLYSLAPHAPGISGHTRTAEYRRWIDAFDYLSDRDRDEYSKRIQSLPYQPRISILMPVFNTPEHLLRETIASVRSQIYENWELCIADDASPKPHVATVLRELADEDRRITFVQRSTNGHISEASNTAFELATGEWIAMLDHDDVLREHALAEIVLALNGYEGIEVIYSDEDKIDEEGRTRFDPNFKPDFSLDLFMTQNYLNHLTVHRAANIRKVGGWRKGFEGSQDYDLNLRVLELVSPDRVHHIPKILYHWRAVAGSTALSSDQKNYAFEAGRRALEEHVRRTGISASVEAVGETVPFYRLRYMVPEPAPLVSIIIPTRDRAELLRLCLTTVLERTSYTNFEILIVDNGSVEDRTFKLYNEFSDDERVRLLHYPGEFNYSAINNFAVSASNGSLICLLNNDIEVISNDWLTEMVSHAVRPSIGCVGAKLYYPDDTIQHGGVILGIGGVAEHAHKGLQRADPGYFGRAMVVQNLSAVTGACLVVRRSVYDEVGGLDERDLKIAFNDVDFCLKVDKAGYRNLWTPFAELYHHESASRGIEDTPEKIERFMAENATMMERWSEAIANDRYYNPHLTRAGTDFHLRLR